MDSLIIVPWMSNEEWEYCRDRLYGDDLSMKKKALQHLYVWEARCPDGLPIRVNCTKTLMEAYIKILDLKEKKDDDLLNNSTAYESWLAFTVMRFLNLVTDSTEGGKASSSVKALAKELGIPDWIVHIRNTASHGSNIPGFALLEQAVQNCLNWLYVNYWNQSFQEDNYIDKKSLTFACFEACLLVKTRLLEGYVLNTLCDEDRMKIETVLYMNQEVPAYFYSNSLESINDMVLKKFSRHVKQNTKYGNELIDTIIRSDDYLINEQAIRDDNKLCTKFLELWKDILTVICENDICAYFIQKLATIVVSPLEESKRKEIAAILLNHILQNINDTKLMLETENSEPILKKQCATFKKVKKGNIPLKVLKLDKDAVQKVLDIVLNEPNALVKIFLKNLLQILDGEPSFHKFHKLRMLLDIYTWTKSAVYSEDSDDDVIFNLSHLNDNTEIKDTTMEVDDCDVTVIDESENWDWSKTPLGILPWQSDFRPWIYIYEDDDDEEEKS